MKPSLVLFSALLCATAPAFTAQPDDPDSAAYTQCQEASNGVTSRMLDCMAHETDRHDLRLNEAYQAALTSLQSGSADRLRSAQRAWIRFRDAECALHGSLTGGSIDRLSGASCLLEMTRERAHQLQQLSSPDA